MHPNPKPLLELPLAATAPKHGRRDARVVRPFSVQRGRILWQGVNLSMGGMLCTAQEPWWPGNVLDLNLDLGQEEPLPVRGEVLELVSVGSQTGMRLRFVDLKPGERARIARWMGSRLS